MKNKYLLLFFVSNFLIILDQLTKYMVTIHVPLHYSISVIEGFFSITHIRNPGVAFGLFAGHESEYKVLFFIVISIIAIIAILVIFHQTPDDKRMVKVGLILIFSGAIGNLIDRILHKEVIDFLDFFYNGSHWPAFNVADSCITIGVSFMIVDLFCGYPEGASSPKPSDKSLQG
ncbi:MAG TPA: signal peptidase II [Nitrospinaceae bacterium]|nr:signal peptidase II [Nitrospinota bacterium]MDP6335619.1 signal peptidase II [Nitrospinaceae bacterium]MDP7149106.1 signal peptidase II [Nitrospinaceae bacterium]HAX47043.1 signal peptidase II [Nitrospina sp.]HJO56644.1 signal peptidase II [Nitrospinaceae bacterium]